MQYHTLLRTNMSPTKALLKTMFLFGTTIYKGYTSFITRDDGGSDIHLWFPLTLDVRVGFPSPPKIIIYAHIWRNGIIFHQPRFPWSKFPFLSYILGWGRCNLTSSDVLSAWRTSREKLKHQAPVALHQIDVESNEHLKNPRKKKKNKLEKTHYLIAWSQLGLGVSALLYQIDKQTQDW